jgi:zinc-binding alcohol dehydrogenase/oxidoreductase
MHAIVLSTFGAARELRPATVPDPSDRPGWVTVRLVASALNWHDVLVRQGKYRSPLPHIIGADGAGRRADNGEEVVILPSLWWGGDESAPGDEWQILGDHTPGTYAEAVSVPEECVLPKPAGLGWHEAAALPLVGVTVYRALVSRGRLRSGESVLVLGAGGGVATMAVAMASAMGAHVFVTSSSRQKIDQAIANGATDGVSYDSADWAAEAKRMSPAGRGFDLALDSVGTWRDSLAALQPGGRLVVLGASRAELAELDVRPFYFGQYDLLGTTMGSARDFRGLLGLMDSASVAPPLIDSVYPLDDAATAHERLESGSAIGKIVLSNE